MCTSAVLLLILDWICIVLQVGTTKVHLCVGGWVCECRIAAVCTGSATQTDHASSCCCVHLCVSLWSTWPPLHLFPGSTTFINISMLHTALVYPHAGAYTVQDSIHIQYSHNSVASQRDNFSHYPLWYLWWENSQTNREQDCCLNNPPTNQEQGTEQKQKMGGRERND